MSQFCKFTIPIHILTTSMLQSYRKRFGLPAASKALVELATTMRRNWGHRPTLTARGSLSLTDVSEARLIAKLLLDIRLPAGGT